MDLGEADVRGERFEIVKLSSVAFNMRDRLISIWDHFPGEINWKFVELVAMENFSWKFEWNCFCSAEENLQTVKTFSGISRR